MPMSQGPVALDRFKEELAGLQNDERVQGLLGQFSRWEPWIRQQQMDVTRIAAPTGLEGLRAEWILRQMRGLGYEQCGIDEVGNAWALTSAESGPVVLVSAHMDTVFPPRTELEPRRVNGLLLAPGISDNGAGLAALLAMLRACKESEVRPARPVLLVANVGEEGEGDLKGMRYLFERSPWRDRIECSLVIDGPGLEQVTTRALGSRRLQVTFRGKGGHSWSDAGAANPIHALGRAVANLAEAPLVSSEHGVRAATAITMVEGGTSVNTIPAAASMKLDLRAIDSEALQICVQQAQQAVSAALEEENRGARSGRIEAQLQVIGDRPAGEVAAGSRLLQALRTVDESLGIRAQFQMASTDANIPLSMGREAIRLGAGGRGGGAHTLEEWFDASGRELGLKRLLLLILLLSGTHV